MLSTTVHGADVSSWLTAVSFAIIWAIILAIIWAVIDHILFFIFLFFSLGWILPSAFSVWVISRCVFVSLKRIASTYTVLHMYYMYRMYHIVPLCVSSRIASHRSTFLCVHLCMYICVFFFSTSGVRAGVTWILDYIWTFELHLLTFDFWLFSYILYSIRYISVPHDLLLL